MTVVWVKEHWEGRGGDADKDGTTYTRTWKIKTNSKWDDAVTIKNDPLGVANLPNYLDPHPSNFFATCRKLTIDQESDSPVFHRASADYSTKPIDTDDPSSEPDPLARPAKIRWSSTQYEQHSEVDRDGNAILNPTADRFEDMPNIDDARWVVSVSKNLAPPLPTWLLNANNRLNSAEFVVGGLTVGVEKAKLQGLAIPELQKENDVEFHEFSFELHYREEGWTTKLPNLSFNEYTTTGGVKSPVLVATVAAGTLATSFENGDVVDGVTLATGDRILIKDQAAGIENGYYTVQASGAPLRTGDCATGTHASGFTCYVQSGTVNAGTSWYVSNVAPTDIVNTDALVLLQFNLVGSLQSPVRVATTAAGTLATSFENGDTIDGVVLATGDRILIKNQVAGTENGYYIVNASGAPTRTSDFSTGIAVSGFICGVTEGTTYTNWSFHVTNPSGSDIVGTDAITFAKGSPFGRKKSPIKIDGQRPSDPQQVNPDGTLVENPTIATATYSEFNRYPTLDFSNLPLT